MPSVPSFADAAHLSRTIKAAGDVVSSLEVLGPATARAADVMAETLLGGRKLLACGNGGSAAQAAHLTTEFVCRFDRDRRPYPAICLTTQGGDLTAISNDYQYEQAFARQVDAYGQPGDVLVALSTSGNSPSIVAALHAARAKQVRVIALLGRDGGQCKGLADVELIVPHSVTARIQEAHLVLVHALCEMVEPALLAQEA